MKPVRRSKYFKRSEFLRFYTDNYQQKNYKELENLILKRELNFVFFIYLISELLVEVVLFCLFILKIIYKVLTSELKYKIVIVSLGISKF